MIQEILIISLVVASGLQFLNNMQLRRSLRRAKDLNSATELLHAKTIKLANDLQEELRELKGGLKKMYTPSPAARR